MYLPELISFHSLSYTSQVEVTRSCSIGDYYFDIHYDSYEWFKVNLCEVKIKKKMLPLL